MVDQGTFLLEIRLFVLHPGVREKFDRISREGTIPLMRTCGITVVAFGPSRNDDNGYYLIRAFRDEAERVERSQSVYATEEWEANFEEPIMSMIDSYHTAVVPVTDELVRRMADGVGLVGNA